MENIVSYRRKEKVSDMFIRQGDTYQRIKSTDIMYVETMQNYLKLHLIDKMYVIHQTMMTLEEMLPQETFFRIHKSYLVNLSFIDKINAGRLIVNGTELPISRFRRDDLLKNVVYKKLISK